jgi:Mrp family chromosome partitioning ATPase
MPLLFNTANASITQSQNGWVPITITEGLSLMSIQYLLDSQDAPVIWRGPKKSAMIKQFINGVEWQCDYLVIDTPPGTSDEHLAILDALRGVSDISIMGSVMVTTPQQLSISDVKKEFNFCAKTDLRVLGVIENMSGYVCPHCQDCVQVFSASRQNNGRQSAGAVLAEQFQVPLLGVIPMDPRLAKSMDEHAFLDVFPSLPSFQTFESIAQQLLH